MRAGDRIPVDGIILNGTAAINESSMTGEPLPLEHGWPLRVVVGSFHDRSESWNGYFWKGGKWLRALEFRANDAPGFWEQNGYHNDADPWKEQRFGY